jgi:hypothetical protein
MPSSILNSDDGVISGTSGLKSSGGDDGVLVFQSKGTETARINTDKQIVAAAGTASLPALTTTGDVNTGIFFPAADTIAFAEGGAEAMRIDSSGNLLVGTTNAAPAVTTSTGIALSSTGYVAASRTSAGSGFFNRLSTDGEIVEFRKDGSLVGGIGAASGGIYFGSGSSNTERMRITSGGKILVGTASQFTTGGFNPLFSIDSGAEALAVFNINLGFAALLTKPSANHSYFAGYFLNSSGTKVGDINVGSSSTAFTTSSDYRLKENIAPMTGALEKVAQLKPVTYTWKVDGSAGQGFIAHELAEVVPDCVSGEKDAVETYTDEDGNEQTQIKPQGIDTSFLVATLTAAIQELKAELDEAKARIAALEAVPGNE